MDIKSVFKKYEEISSSSSKRIYLLYEQKNFKIGKRNDSICFIVESNGGKLRKYRKGDLSIELNKEYIISDIPGIYSIIFFNNTDKKKLTIFIETLSSIVKDDYYNSEDLLTLYNSITDVFREIKFNYSSYIGYFGELIFIYLMNKMYDINMVQFYQATDNHLIDFLYDNINFEVKTSLTSKREHTINNDQVSGKGYIVSILLKENNVGFCFSELFSKISELFDINPKKKAYINNFILSIPSKEEAKRFLIENNIVKFYSFSDIPKFESYHESISKIKYTINLSNIKSSNLEDVMENKE